MTKQEIRLIVKDAFKIDELVYQFEEIDVADKYLETGSIAEVNSKYSDEYLLGEARNWLDIALDEYNVDEPEWQRQAAQLRRFIKKWETDKCATLLIS